MDAKWVSLCMIEGTRLKKLFPDCFVDLPNYEFVIFPIYANALVKI